jgi:putative flippase GtrA
MSNWRAESTYLGRHVGSGALNTLVGFAIIFILMWLGVSPYISNVAGYAVGFIFGFLLSKKFVFRSNGHYVTESIRYLIAFLISFLCNLLILHFLLTNFNAVASQVLAAAGYTVIMYILARMYVFKIGDKPHQI